MSSADNGPLHDLMNRLAGAKDLGGVLKIDVQTDTGAATWYLDIAKGELTQTEHKPTAIVRGHEADLEALVRGTMSVQDGLLTGRLQISGDVAYLHRLFGVITPAKK